MAVDLWSICAAGNAAADFVLIPVPSPPRKYIPFILDVLVVRLGRVQTISEVYSVHSLFHDTSSC